MIYKTNITAEELKKAYEYAIENGHSKFKTIAITFEDTDIGAGVGVHHDWDEEPIDITNYGSW